MKKYAKEKPAETHQINNSIFAITCIVNGIVFGLLNIVIDITETTETTVTETTEDPDRGPFADGIYSGSGSGYRGITEVTVTVENGYITDIELVHGQENNPESSLQTP